MENIRINQILELLTDENKMEVATLAKKLGVSQVTIRKDLDTLENRRIIVREHGFALLRNADDISGRMAYHYEAKKVIAKKAAELVSDGDTIMIESGSCCALLAEELAASKKDLTIITNSAFIADYIRGNSNLQIILLGGIYQPNSQVTVGPMVLQCAENFLVDLFFIGTDGYSARGGFTNKDQMRAQAVRDMAKQASRVVVLTESSKFSKHGIVPLNLKGKIKFLVTDEAISPSVKAKMTDVGICMITAGKE
ncbi:MAG: DeoR/GlpR family DNA-binding transcription regulator [Eubacteriales bacterium]|nr:DeoR/GlpR family DNA-binding transcription regulator [Eubacteriales bacterium]